MSDKIVLNTIEEAIEEIKNGKVIIVVDDEDRENEGDFVCAAECITPEIVNFMATHGRGLICAPLIEDRCDELGLELMVGKNTAHPLRFLLTSSGTAVQQAFLHTIALKLSVRWRTRKQNRKI